MQYAIGIFIQEQELVQVDAKGMNYVRTWKLKETTGMPLLLRSLPRLCLKEYGYLEHKSAMCIFLVI
jgi:hypothetical protein